jgi:hypothetical protein
LPAQPADELNIFMTIEQLRTLHQARPFRAFDMHLADQRVIGIEHPELLAILPPGRTVFVGHSDGTFEFVDLLLVTRLKSRNRSPGRGRHS